MPSSSEEPVSRLPRLSEHPDNPDLAAAFDAIRARGGELINLHLTLGHAPKIFKARLGLSYALRHDAVTPRRLRELVILRTAQLGGSEYELAQHIPVARQCGISQAQLDGLAGDWRREGLFDARERALLAHVDQLVGNNGRVDDATFAELMRHFGPEEIVELTITATHYVTTGLLTRSLGIKPEADGRNAMGGKV